MNKKNTIGFTMVELIIVMGVIAILGGIILVGIDPGRQFAQARNNQRVAHVNRIYGAFREYFSQNNSYPDCLSGEGEEVDVITCDELYEEGHLPSEGFTDPVDCEGSGYFAKIDEESGRLGVVAICTEIDEELIKSGYWDE